MKLQFTRPDWTRGYRHTLTRYERALRALWLDSVLVISDEEFAEIGRTLGLTGPLAEILGGPVDQAPQAPAGPQIAAQPREEVA